MNARDVSVALEVRCTCTYKMEIIIGVETNRHQIHEFHYTLNLLTIVYGLHLCIVADKIEAMGRLRKKEMDLQRERKEITLHK